MQEHAVQYSRVFIELIATTNESKFEPFRFNIDFFIAPKLRLVLHNNPCTEDSTQSKDSITTFKSIGYWYVRVNDICRNLE